MGHDEPVLWLGGLRVRTANRCLTFEKLNIEVEVTSFKHHLGHWQTLVYKVFPLNLKKVAKEDFVTKRDVGVVWTGGLP